MAAALPHRPSRFTPARPWSPLSDEEWSGLYPYLLHRTPAGRQVGDLRARMDAIFHMACRGPHIPWREVPEFYGRADTVSRFFRRLTHAGLWHAILRSLAHPDLPPEHPIRRIAHYVVRATRRAARLGGLRLLFLIKRLGVLSALPAPSWLLPDERLSELCRTYGAQLPEMTTRQHGETERDFRATYRRYLRNLKRLHRMAGGRARIPRALRLCWP